MLANTEIDCSSVTKETAVDFIKSQIASNQVLIYMKGNADLPQCGYSARVIQIMNILGINYKTIDVLKNPEIREQIKVYSSWPTIPQVYLNEEFLGGCDILIEMYQSGSLQSKLSTS